MAIPTFFKKVFLCLVLSTSFVTNGQNALDFDGVDDYVQTDYSGISGPCTIEAWINTTITPSIKGTIVEWALTTSGGTPIPLVFTFFIDTNNLFNVTYSGTGSEINAVTALNDGIWHHLAAVYDNNFVIKLYVDGILEATSLPNWYMSNSTPYEDMTLGSSAFGNGNLFEGKIDEFRIWYGAKTQAELIAGMNNEICSAPSDLVAYYKFNQGVANGINTGVINLPDYSGNGYNGTLTNMALTGTSSNWVTGVALGMGTTYSIYNETVCSSYTWPVNGTTYSTSGNYSEAIPGGSYLGCDSTSILNLNVVPLVDSVSTIIGCGSYTWPVNGTTYTASTSVTEFLTNGQGCDYAHTLNLTVGSNNSSSESITTCDSYFWPTSSVNYFTGGIYSQTLTNISGCDSVVTLNLTINPSESQTTLVNTCDSYTWPVNGLTYTNSGIYLESLTNSNGCDSLLYLNITINPSSSSTSTSNVTACDAYTWSANGTTYTSSGSFTETLTNMNGCDSVTTLSLTINSVDNTAQDNGDGTLSANLAGATYQWIDCSNNTAVVGETNQVFTPTVNGSYAVVVSANNCSDTSACITVSTIGIEEGLYKNFNFYPNPTDGHVTIDLGKIHESISVSIYTIAGRFVSEITEHDTSEMSIDLNGSAGVYLMEIQTESGETATFRVAKK